MVESLKGVVLADREHNYYDDSDWYVLYWDVEHQAIREAGYRTTRGGGTDNNYATVDATDEVKMIAQKYLEDEYFKMLVNESDEKAGRVMENKKVIVTGGRKVKKGTVGVLFWHQDMDFNGNHVTKIGIRDDDGNVHWTYAHNVKVHNPDQYKESNDKLKEIAVNAAAKQQWGMHFAMRRGMLYC